MSTRRSMAIFGYFVVVLALFCADSASAELSDETQHFLEEGAVADDDDDVSHVGAVPRTGRAARIVESGRGSAVSSTGNGKRFYQQSNAASTRNVPPPNALYKVLLTNYSEAKCNDGSPAGYYIRRSPYGSKVWFVYLEGGWFCFDADSCEWRLQNYNQYMSSRKWDEYRPGIGILSGDPEENPLFYVHNFVIVQYCSSDLWAGTFEAPDPNAGWSFLGSRIVDAVFADLLQRENLGEADVVYMAGSSAGGLGVLLNIDRVTTMLESHGVSTRGIVDSAWFLDLPPSKASQKEAAFKPACISSGVDKCNSNLRDYMKIGMKLWRHRLPSFCEMNFSPDDMWKCLFANNSIQYVTAPVMVVQFLYDEVQSLVSQMARPSTLEDWRHVVWLGSEVRRSLRPLRYVFAPACYSHSALIQPSWAGLASSSTYRSMGEVMECWMYKLDRALTRKKGKLISTRSPLPPNTRHQSHVRLTNRCHARALDGCDDPLCNRSCPKVTDPGTGNELNLFESIMRSDMSAVMQVANILDLDPSRLSAQDRGLVLRMLVRRSGSESDSSD